MSASGAKILLVEDDEQILDSLAEVLSDYYDVSKTTSLAQAWKMIQENKFPVVIMDLNIPPYLDDQDSGVYLFDKISRNFPDTKIIIISAHANPQHREMFDGAGAVFFEKPFSLDQILDTLESFGLETSEA